MEELPFEIASGTVTGRDHLTIGRGSQDGLCILRHRLPYSGEEFICGMVCDGCGSSEHSEVGAKLGAKMLVHALSEEIGYCEQYMLPSDNVCSCSYLRQTESGRNKEVFHHIIEHARKTVASKLSVLSSAMGNTLNSTGKFSQTETISQYLLFTAIGFIISPKTTIIFSLGDGVASLNGEIKSIDSGETNAPAYLAYEIVNTIDNQKPKFSILWEVPTEQVKNLLIGTDGARFILKNEKTKVPGKEDCVGPLSQFWDADFFFSNSDGLRRRLSLLNRTMTTPGGEKEHGLLLDDTTIIAVRRRK